MKKFLCLSAVLICGSMPLLAQPTITQQPTNQVVALGGTMTLSVTASDPLAAYQWFKDGCLIIGATNGTLTVVNAGTTNSGSYYVVVTSATGMAISLPALIEIGAPALLAWGINSAGQLGDGTTANKATPEFIAGNAVTAAGGSASLFVTIDGSLWVMGANNSGQMGTGSTSLYAMPTPTNVANNVVAVAAGSSHSLFVKSDGTLWAMGLNSSGQLGDSTTANRSSPVAVIGGTNVIAVAAGFAHSLFLKSDGTLWAMGLNSSGQLGDGTGVNQTSPVAVVGGTNVIAVAAGQLHSLFLKSDGTLWVMGRNNYGQLGNGTTSATSQPIVVGSNVVAIAAGGGHSLFVEMDGSVWGMGLNSNGQLGDGTTANRTTPVPAVGGTNVLAVAAGPSHSLFLKNDGTLWATGLNSSGQLGDGTTANRTTPVPVVVTNISFAAVHSGNAANCSLAIGQTTLIPPFSATTQMAMPVTATNATLNGMVLPSGTPAMAWFKWGPLGSYTQVTTPVNVGSGYNVVRVSALINGLIRGNVYQCSLVASNSTGVVTGAVQWFRVDQAPKVAAWGNNGSGQLQVPQNLTNVMALAGGAYHSLALLANGAVQAWGANSLGQCNVPATATNVVALGTGYGQSIPISLALRSDGTVVAWGNGVTVPPTLNNVVAVAAGDVHCLALQADGTVVSWILGYPYYGYENYGQANVPAGLTNVIAISGGATHSLVLKGDGTVLAWGDNSGGGTNIPPNATNVIAIAAGSFHDLALRADGTVVAWGNNYNGQLNFPPGMSNVVAIAAGGFDSMALKSDGTVVDSGEFYYGQSFLPVGLSNVVDIACGGFAQYALGGNVPPAVNSQTNDSSENLDMVFTPVLSDANNDPLTCRVGTLPAGGTLYQYASGARGPQITSPGTLVTDVSNRVIFAPAPNIDGAPYATFGLVANDGQADSAPGTMTINVFRAPQNFAAQNLGAGFQLQLAGTPNYPYILQMATNLTPPVVWQSILTNPADGNGNWDWSMTNLPANPAGFYRAVVQ